MTHHTHLEPDMCPCCEGDGCYDCAHTGCSDVGPYQYHYSEEEEEQS